VLTIGEELVTVASDLVELLERVYVVSEICYQLRGPWPTNIVSGRNCPFDDADRYVVGTRSIIEGIHGGMQAGKKSARISCKLDSQTFEDIFDVTKFSQTKRYLQYGQVDFAPSFPPHPESFNAVASYIPSVLQSRAIVDAGLMVTLDRGEEGKLKRKLRKLGSSSASGRSLPLIYQRQRSLAVECSTWALSWEEVSQLAERIGEFRFKVPQGQTYIRYSAGAPGQKFVISYNHVQATLSFNFSFSTLY